MIHLNLEISLGFTSQGEAAVILDTNYVYYDGDGLSLSQTTDLLM
jgi:hypothetical protein